MISRKKHSNYMTQHIFYLDDGSWEKLDMVILFGEFE